MNYEPTKGGWVAALLGVLLVLAGTPALAQKKPGGGTTTDCSAPVDFPAFIYGVTITSSRVSEVDIRIADAMGRCSRSLARVPGVERRPLLMALEDGVWRAVWPDGDGYDNTNDGLVVQDFRIGAQASVDVIGSGRVASGRVTGLEAAAGGDFLFQRVNLGEVPTSVWHAGVSTGPDDSAQRIIATTKLADVGHCALFDIALGPDGDSLYFTAERADGQQGNSVRRVSLSSLTAAGAFDAACGTQVLEVLGGHIVQLAAGPCPPGSTGTCLALERHNVRGIPCTPDYYRTDVFALDTSQSSTLQLAYPSWAPQGALYGRQTGSTSKNSCTAKIYTTIVRHQLGGNLASDSMTTLGTATSIDAPNPMP